MSLRQLKGVDPDFLSISQPQAQDAAKLPALRHGDKQKEIHKPAEVMGSEPGRKDFKVELNRVLQPQLPAIAPKEQLFSGSYAALTCKPGSPAVRALLLQQAVAVADLAFQSLLDQHTKCTMSYDLPTRYHMHQFVRKIITPKGALQTDMTQFSSPKPSGKEAADHSERDSKMQAPAEQHAFKKQAAETPQPGGIHHTVVNAPTNVEVSRCLKSVETHAQELSEWDQKSIEPVSCAKDARYFVITPITMLDDATRVVSLAAETYARCRLGRLSPAVGSPVFPDAPSLTLTPRQSTHAASPLPSKPSTYKQSAAMQEAFQKSLAQVQTQLAPAPSADKTATEQKSSTVATGGASDAARNPTPPAEARVPNPPAEATQQPRNVSQDTSLTHKPGVLQSLRDTYPAAEASMPCYGLNGYKQAATPASAPGDNDPDDNAKAPQPRPEPLAGSVWYHQAVTQVSYQLQRQLLVESRRKTTFTGSIRSKQEPCVVVYVVVPSDSAAEVLHALHVVAQALAPCSSLGLAEVKAQLQESSCAASLAGESRAGRAPDEEAQQSMQDRYGPVEPPRCYSNIRAREWPSILEAAAPKPTSIVLQAITRSMCANTSPHVVRSMAFSIYSKAAGSQLSGRTSVASEHQDVPEAAQPSGTAAPAAVGDMGHCRTAGLLHEKTNDKTVKSTDATHSHQDRSINNDTRAKYNSQQSQKQPAPFSWAGCCAGAQAFRVAETQQTCTLASEAAEPAADPDLGKVFRETKRSGAGLKPSLVRDNQRTPSRSKSVRVNVEGSRHSLSPMHASPRRTSSSQSKLPFSDTSSSPSSSQSSPGSQAPRDNSDAAKFRKGVDGARSRADSMGAPFRSGPPSRPGSAAHDREHVASTRHEQQPIQWHSSTVLHCTYAMRARCSDRLVVSMAWSDSRGELLQQVAEEVPCACTSHTAQAAATRAWVCAQVLLRHSTNVLRQPESSTYDHLCVTLMPDNECEQWVWMHLPQLLEAVALHGCVLPERITHICVVKVAVDNPVQYSRYSWWPNVAKESSMCVSCPSVRPMFLKHIESTPMRTFRQWNTWGTVSKAPSEAAGRRRKTRSRSTEKPLTSTKWDATPRVQSPAPDQEMTSPVPSHPASSPSTNGAPEQGAAADVKRGSSLPAAPLLDEVMKTPPAKPVVKYINQEPLSSGQIPDSEPRPPNGNATSQITAAGPSGAQWKNVQDHSHANGMAEDSDAAQAGPSQKPSVLGKRSREPSATGAKQFEGATQDEQNLKIEQCRNQWGASATVMWRTPWYTGQVVVPEHERLRGRETLRLLHVALLCQWRVQLAVVPDSEQGKGDVVGSSQYISGHADDQKQRYHVQWLQCTDDCAMASAMALHQLALLHRCHWEISLQSALGDIFLDEPLCAQWPIHCALAARGGLLSEMLQF